MNPMAYFRRLASKRRDRIQRPEVLQFEAAAAELEPGDIAIDCGANIGKFTLPMAKSGATVYAFEPNPDAFAQLEKNLAGFTNAHLLQAAVTAKPGTVKLYLHKYSADDPIHFSTGSSLVEAKRNVRKDKYIMVEGVPLAEFIKGLGRQRVRLLKMDIEGAEVEVLNELLDAGLHQCVDQAFVEVHDRQIKQLAEPTRKLKERLRALNADHFRLDWR